MDRRWFVGLFGLALTGCASSRSDAPSFKVPMAEGSPFAGMAPIDKVINLGPGEKSGYKMAKTGPKPSPSSLPPVDSGATRASLKSATPTSLPPPEIQPVNLPEPEARPAPYAQTAPAGPRPQAPPEIPPVGRSAPYVERQPTAPRPQAAPVALPAAREKSAGATTTSSAPNELPELPSEPAPSTLPPLPTPAVSTPPSSANTLPPLPPPTVNTPPSLPSPDANTPPPLPPPTVSTPPTDAPVVNPVADNAPPMLPTGNPLMRPPGDLGLKKTGASDAPKPRDEYATLGRPAARVGEEIITMRQLSTAIKEKMELIPPEQRGTLTREDKERLTDAILTNLIDRAVILQAAKKQMKDPKQLKGFYDAIEKYWIEHEVPPLLKQYNATNIVDLRSKLEAKGKDYEDLHDDFRQNTLAQEYVSMRMKVKMNVSLPEMLSYYDKHYKEYDRPAQIVWREMVVELAKYPSRAAAKTKADLLLAQLRRGDDFAQLAQAESNGPTASQGGKWETSPGSYGIPSVNDALNRLPINQLSQVIEAPLAFHIVRVEQRRSAGPARFDEVQDQVRNSVMEEKRRGAAAKFVSGLRENTMITTMFDKAPSDPAALKVGGTPGR